MGAGQRLVLRRWAFVLFGLLCLAGALRPARADVGSVVVVARGQFTPGDDKTGTKALLPHGYDLEFANLDKFGLGPHTMTSIEETTGHIVFDSGTLEPGKSITIDTKGLEPGTYRFFCSTHYFTGTLQVI